MPELSVRAANGCRERYPLAGERTIIGRSRSSDIVLPDQWLSRRHAEIVRRGETFFIADLGSRNGTLVNGARIEGERPLQPGDRITLGVYDLTFSWDEPTSSAEEEGAEFELVASSAARQIADLDTHPDLDQATILRRRRLLAVLTRTADALVRHRSAGELFEGVLDGIFEALPAQRAAILLREGPSPGLVACACRSVEATAGPVVVSRSIAGRVLDRRVAVLVPRVADDPELRTHDSVRNLGIRSALCAPLWVDEGTGEGQVLGIVYVDRLEDTPSFTEEDLKFLTALANLAAQRTETLRLVRDNLDRPALEADMRRAAEIQVGLLPREVPDVPGYAVAGANVPCRAVGSDYYDYALVDGRLRFALADVAGKGTGAALLATASRVSVRAHWGDPSLAAAMGRINRAVCQCVPGNRYISFFLGRLEPETGRLAYVNAGLNPPLLVRANGAVDALAEGGPVLGVLCEAAYAEGSAEIRPGDTLLVFSDGVGDTFASDGAEFGLGRLLEAVRDAGALDAGGLRDELLRRLHAFSAGAPPTDDRTLLVLDRR